MNSKTIVFIHGLFMNPESWKAWKAFFESAGYTCHAPAYPFHEGSPGKLRESINPGLAKLTLGDVTSHLRHYIDQLPEKPILIGHSMGGLLVQLLVSEGRGRAGVCIDSAAPKGVASLTWSFLKSNLPVINPFAGNSVFVPTVNWFHYAFCGVMSMDDTRAAFEQYVVPESRNIPRSSTGKAGAVDFSKPHAPLLFIAGERDHIIPASLNKANARAYKHVGSPVDYKEFAGRSHFICGQQGWEEVAAYVRDWLSRLA